MKGVCAEVSVRLTVSVNDYRSLVSKRIPWTVRAATRGAKSGRNELETSKVNVEDISIDLSVR